MADKVIISQMNNLVPNVNQIKNRLGVNRWDTIVKYLNNGIYRPSLNKNSIRKKSKVLKARQLSPKSALKEELSKIRNIKNEIINKTEK